MVVRFGGGVLDLETFGAAMITEVVRVRVGEQ